MVRLPNINIMAKGPSQAIEELRLSLELTMFGVESLIPVLPKVSHLLAPGVPTGVPGEPLAQAKEGITPLVYE